MIGEHFPFGFVDDGTPERASFSPDYRAEADRWYVVAHDLARIIATHLFRDCDRCPMQGRGCDATIDACETCVMTLYAEGALRDAACKQW